MEGVEKYPEIFLVSTLIMLTLVGFIIFFVLVYQRRLMRQRFEMLEREAVHQQKLLSATIETQEIERQRIARDLHDEIGAMLSAVKMNLSLASRKTEEPKKLSPLLDETSDMLKDSIQQVRHISHALLPPLLDKFGLVAALKSMVAKAQKEEGPQLLFKIKGEEVRLEPQKELGLYRVALEFINNAIKHAEAKQIRLHLQYEEDKISLEIKDNGKGFDLEGKKKEAKGLGLRNIESRIQAIGGEYSFQSSPGNGTHLQISLKSGSSNI